MAQSFPRLSLALAATVWACAPQPGQVVPPGTGLVPIEITSPFKPGSSKSFTTQAYDVSDVYKANVSVDGPGMSGAVNATGNPITMPNGQGSTAVQVVVPVGNNRVITAAGLDRTNGALPSWITVKGVTNVASGVNAAVAVNWTTTPTAKVIEALRTAGSAYAATVNAAQIQTLVNQITVPAVAGGTTTYTVHPSRVDATVIANAIIAASGAVPGSPPPGSAISAGTISGTVTGVAVSGTPYSMAATVVANDPGSAAVTTNAAGTYTITGVTPGTAITVKATNSVMDTVTGSATVAAGGTGTANMTMPALHYLPRSLFSNGSTLVNKVLRWSRMPINILIVKPANAAAIGWTADHRQAVYDSMSRWSSELGDVISFSTTECFDNDAALATKKANADIWVNWVANFGDGKLGYAQYQFSYCSPCSPDSTNLSTEIRLAVSLSNGTALPDYSYRSVAEHEFGHALGSVGNSTTNGHSDLDTDLMYFSTDPYWPINLLPTARDFKTMRFLYSLPANITRS